MTYIPPSAYLLPATGVLSAGATHYAIPDVETLSGYLEVFEHPGVTQCVLLESVLNQVCMCMQWQVLRTPGLLQ